MYNIHYMYVLMQNSFFVAFSKASEIRGPLYERTQNDQNRSEDEGEDVDSTYGYYLFIYHWINFIRAL